MRTASLLWLLALAVGHADGPDLVRVQEQGPVSAWLARPARDPLTVKLSETLAVVLRVEGKADLEVVLGEIPRDNEGWTLREDGKPKITPMADPRQVRWEQGLQAMPLKPGAHPLRLPGLKFTENDGPEQTVAWDPVPLQIVTRVAKVDVAELRDRTEIEELPVPPEPPRPWWPWLFVLAPVLALSAVALHWCFRRRPVVLSPSAVAFRSMQELERQLPTDATQVSVWHGRLADVLRQYLEHRYDCPATRRTTAELVTTPGLPLVEEQVTLLGEICKLCDLAKFAGGAMGSGETESVLTLARAFVEQTSRPPSVGKLPAKARG
jgi:hypothetical protein